MMDFYFSNEQMREQTFGHYRQQLLHFISDKKGTELLPVSRWTLYNLFC